MTFAYAYAKFRGSKIFLIVLASILFVWIGWNELPFLPHFDDEGFGRLNLFLSTEASLSVALLMMANDKQDALAKKQMEYQQHLLEAVLHLLEHHLNISSDQKEIFDGK